jgi:cytochrome c biogenesis protein CcmG/thiol:disulfide interchange protein DsbE
MNLANEKNLKLLGVNFKDKKNQANFFLTKFGNPYDFLAKDELGKQSINFGIYGIPESILINKDLLIIKKFVGPLSAEDFNIIKQIIN